VPYRDFDAARRAYAGPDREPIEFTYGGERFTCLPDPTLGDCFDIHDAPELDPNDFDPNRPEDLLGVRSLAKFIEKMLPYEDRPRFQKAHYSIPSSQAIVIYECAGYIVEEYTNRPTEPSGTSSPSPASAGRISSE